MKVYLNNEGEIKCFILQILNALKCLESRNLMHRDIKLSNILVSSEGIVKLADFGLARRFGNININ